MGTLQKSHIDLYIGPKLRAKRLEKGLSQEELGKAANITFQQIQKYEKSTNRVSASTLFKLASHLGVHIGYFFDGLDVSNEYGFANDSKAYGLSDIDGKYTASPIVQELEELVKAYASVKDSEARKSILKLVQSLSEQQKATQKVSAND